MISGKLRSYRFGILAEFITILFLRVKFYRIIARRYKTRFGEIDIVATRGKTLVAIEVKARKVNRKAILIEEVLSNKQVERIKMATRYFLSKNSKYQDFLVRFDFVFVGKNYLPIHYKNYWR